MEKKEEEWGRKGWGRLAGGDPEGKAVLCCSAALSLACIVFSASGLLGWA